MSVIESWGVNEWVAVSSAALALLSLLLNWSVVRRQIALQYESLKAQTDGEAMAWANEAIDQVSEGVLLARGRGAVFGGDEMRRRLLEVSQRLSSLADRGRLFFPNEDHHAHGQDKESAYQGFRPVILDAVIFAHYQLDRIDPNAVTPDQDACNYLVRCRRLLVSEVQNAVDPRRRGRMLRRLAVGRAVRGGTAFSAAAALADDLLARYPEMGIDARGPEWIAKRMAVAQRRKR
ncbi:MAG: hypothetical protein ABUL73_04175 [Alphaproteobacteria bacterium]